MEIETRATENGEPASRLHIQPCHSSVWDTALTINALIETGLPLDHPVLLRGASWLRSFQTSLAGDWIVSSPTAKPGGWYFQFENEWYPDVDDTAAVTIALTKLLPLQLADLEDKAIRCGSQWALAMQSSNGGWAAFDVENEFYLLEHMPFADHGALLDPPSSDVTARCVSL